MTPLPRLRRVQRWQTIAVALVLASTVTLSCTRTSDSVSEPSVPNVPESTEFAPTQELPTLFDEPRRFDSLDDFREAYVEVGGTCPKVTLRPSRQRERTSGDCSDNVVLSVFEDDAAVKQSILGSAAFITSTAESFGINPSPMRLVVGPNWILNASSASMRSKVAEAFGGEVVSTDDEDVIYDLYRSVSSTSSNGGLSELTRWCTIKPLDVRGDSISFDTEGRDDLGGDTILDVYCTLAIVQAPSYIFELIQTTRALDGRQSEEWDQFKASWSFHPDDGLRLVLVFSEN